MADRCVLLLIYSGQQIHHMLFFFFLMFLYALVYASRLLTLGLPLSIPTPLCLQLFSAVFLYATKILQDNDLTQSLCCCFNCSPEWRIRQFFKRNKSRKGAAAGTRVNVISIAALPRNTGCILGSNCTRGCAAREHNTTSYQSTILFHQRAYILNLFTGLGISLKLRTLFFTFYSCFSALISVCDLIDCHGASLRLLNVNQVYIWGPMKAHSVMHFSRHDVLPHCQSSSDHLWHS